MVHKEKQVNINFNFTQTLGAYTTINPSKTKSEINYTFFKLEEKTNRSVKKNKNNFINVIRDKFALIIR